MSPSVKAGCPFAVDDRGAGMKLSIVMAGLERVRPTDVEAPDTDAHQRDDDSYGGVGA